MPRNEVAIHPRMQSDKPPIRSWRGDWVLMVVADPNGPVLGFMGQVDGWDDKGVRLSNEIDVHVPYSTILYCHAIDGPVTGPIEWDPQRPTT